MNSVPYEGVTPDRDECIEQTYFFRTFRDRLLDDQPTQVILKGIDEELLTITRLPTAVQFLYSELKHTGLLSSGFARLPHYFTPFQTFVVKQTEEGTRKFTIATALVVLEREARYKSESPTQPGLFVFQFETIARNRLGYEAGFRAVAGDPYYVPEWKAYVDVVRRQLGAVDLCDLIYTRSDLYVKDRRGEDPDYVPPVPPLFAEKEGRIAKGSRGRDPLLLFAALQRQLGYPEVPKPELKTDVGVKLMMMEAKLREMETRLKIVEAEQRGTFDPTQFGKPEMFRNMPEV